MTSAEDDTYIHKPSSSPSLPSRPCFLPSASSSLPFSLRPSHRRIVRKNTMKN
ncbi:hypothetical protein K440DRAFT_618122 [Wilcoxina mikolae CBS 423.85]|nr:hypothetical protein K440DRAFT_618122 [Wilcoxina mikolae CBS 423.85]